ncbi:MAG: class II aldolase/adducin family protein, partial [Pseudomonadota bacterium]
SNILPIDQNTATFFNRYVIDDDFGGLAFEDEGERCAAQLGDPSKKVIIMGNHGILIMGDNPADCFNRMYYFERAAETYIRALQTGLPLRVLSDEIAEKTAHEIETYPGQAKRHLAELMAVLDKEGSDYAS